MALTINETTTWQEITQGLQIYEPATSKEFLTGEWRTSTPVTDWDRCKQCLLCVPYCPDSSIPVKDEKRLEFDYDHCKGCGICASACPFGAISMLPGSKPKRRDGDFAKEER
ncbi:pyruvate synthase subunit PorD [Lachnospiraceae bacterium]|jgi:pyruvate ferredoxin oxidoreductase delta subunit|nr:4Fe-4S binding protein [Eubacterium sp.]MCI9210993.1 4Fe-4S binding protein [Eubacterium sp.]GFI25342.1 pyruvate synthase subunit PorD [Lachnospiraceae bacterium]